MDRYLAIQDFVNGLIWVLALILIVVTLLMIFVHITTNVKNAKIHKMREQILYIINIQMRTEQMRRMIMNLLKDQETIDISCIPGIRSKLGAAVLVGLLRELDDSKKEALRAAVCSKEYLKYIKKSLLRRNPDHVILLIKLIGELKMPGFSKDIVSQIYRYKDNAYAQHIGMFSLSLLGEGEGIVCLCGDKNFTIKLSFRSLQEIFASFNGDKERLYSQLLDTAQDVYIHRTCIKRIGSEKMKGLAEKVIPYLTSANFNIRIDAIRTLGELKYKSAAEIINDQVKDEHWEVRSAAITALAEIDRQKYFEELIRGLCDQEWWVRYRAATALTTYPDPEKLLQCVAATGDRFAAEIMSFAIRKDELIKGGQVA